MNKISFIKIPVFKVSSNLLGASLIGAIGGLIFWIISTNNYDENQIGISFTLISGATLIATISKLGFDIGLVRFYSIESNREKLVRISYLIPGIAAFCFSLIYIIIVLNLSIEIEALPIEYWHIAIFSFIVILLTLSNIQYHYAIAIQKTRYCLLQSFLFQGGRLTFIIPLIFVGVFGVFYSFGIGTVIGFIIIFIILIYYRRKIGIERKKVEKYNVKYVFKYSLGNYFQGIFELIPIQLLPTLVMIISGETENAYFGVAWIFAVLLMTFPASASFALFSEGARDPNNLRNLIRQSSMIGLAILILLSIIILPFHNYILNLFGENYANLSYPALRIFVIGAFLYFIYTIYISILRIKMQIRKMLIVSFIMMLSCLIFAILYIPLNGGEGAAVAWVSGQAITMIGITILERKEIFKGMYNYARKYAKV